MVCLTLELSMKPAKVILAVVLGIVAIIIAFSILSTAIGWIIGVIKGLLGLAIGVAIIGGLGWVIIRLLGKKPITSSKREYLP